MNSDDKINGKHEQNKAQAQESQTAGQSRQNEAEPVIVESPKQEKVEQVDYKDLYLRVSADFQNYQRRVEKQKSEWIIIAQESMILKLIPVIEDLDRALSTQISTTGAASTEGTASTGVAKWVEGLVVVQKNLKKSLQDLGVEEISPVGDFNPEFQEAVAQIDSPAHKSGQIVDVVCKGYKFKDKVVKYAQVVVAK